ncbi:hypothetical protein A6R68_18918, partial [Neotoma lepida]
TTKEKPIVWIPNRSAVLFLNLGALELKVVHSFLKNMMELELQPSETF